MASSNEIQRFSIDALPDVVTSADLKLQLARQGIVNQTLAEQVYEQQQREQTESQRESRALDAFTLSLPVAEPLKVRAVQAEGGSAGVYDYEYRFHSADSQSKRLLDATLVWVSTLNSMTFSKSWQTPSRDRWEVLHPTYVVGKRLGPTNRNMSDRKIDLLLSPAFWMEPPIKTSMPFGDGPLRGEKTRPSLSIATVSQRAYDEMEWLSREELGRPLDVDEHVRQRESGFLSTADTSIRRIRANTFAGEVIDRVPLSKLPPDDMIDRKNPPKKIVKLHKAIGKRGLKSTVPRRLGHGIDASDLADFSVIEHAAELARLFGEEQAFQDMIDKLA